MKIRRLNETDLARFVAMDPDARTIGMRRMLASSFTSFNYKPLRKMTAALLNDQTPMFGPKLLDPFEKLLPSLERECLQQQSNPELAFEKNSMVAKGLRDLADQHGVFTRRLSATLGHLIPSVQIKFCEDYLLFIEGRPHLAFIDPRASNRLDPASSTIIFAMQDHLARAYDPNLRDVGLAVIQFSTKISKPSGLSGIKSRAAQILIGDAMPIMRYDELQRRVIETLKEWERLFTETQNAKRGEKPTEKRGTLL